MTSFPWKASDFTYTEDFIQDMFEMGFALDDVLNWNAAVVEDFRKKGYLTNADAFLVLKTSMQIIRRVDAERKEKEKFR